MLKSGGINIAPREIEVFLQDQPGVAEAYVVGVPDTVKGEVPVAVVVAEPGASPDAGMLRRACRTELAAYKTPRRIEIVERTALPVTATGKVPQARARRTARSAVVVHPVGHPARFLAQLRHTRERQGVGLEGRKLFGPHNTGAYRIFAVYTGIDALGLLA